MSTAPHDHPKSRVLVVDDDPYFQQIAQALLENNGRRVTVAATGAAALARMAEPPPELVLLDLGLPDLSGLEVLHHFRSAPTWGKVKILMLTASHETDHIVRAKQAGASGYLCKPIQPDTLAAMVSEILDQGTLSWLDDYTRIHKSY